MKTNTLDAQSDLIFSKLTTKAKEMMGKHFFNSAVFGSRARGDFAIKSDLDICIILNTSEQVVDDFTYNIGSDVLDIQEDSSIDISIFTISLDRFLNSEASIYKNIKKEGIFWEELNQ